ncbi:MAG: hypothetical protein KDK08_05245 [Rhizobiaceae bacterium]|nr:hypothetical protein [Rhizobiaceae bacterium]MCC0000875.1 hypothetical protein [Methylobacteriaceae bacterium]
MTETSLLAGQGALSEYYDWFAASRPGDILVYWRGDLNADREFAPDSSVVDNDERIKRLSLHAVATAIRRDAQRGSLNLTQIRHGDSDYTYRATRKATQIEAASRLLSV